MFDLTNKVALITGASSGIGRATALLFAQKGAQLVLTGRRREALDALVDSLEREGSQAVAVAGDVTEESLALELVDTAERVYGGLDVAVHNAGTLGPLGDSAQVTLSDWEQTIRVNLTAAFCLAQPQIKAMRRRGGGSIVFTSTFVGHTVGFPGAAAYAASKAGLLGLTKALASEYGRENIRVNALLPGGTDTPMGRVMTSTQEELARVKNMHALGRLARPEEIAQAALFLAGDASSFCTGSVFLADGGISIYR